jgi:hypothetical protein
VGQGLGDGFSCRKDRAGKTKVLSILKFFKSRPHGPLGMVPPGGMMRRGCPAGNWRGKGKTVLGNRITLWFYYSFFYICIYNYPVGKA